MWHCDQIFTFLYINCYKWFFVSDHSLGGGVPNEHLMRAQAFDSHRKGMSRRHRSFPKTKTGRGLSKMTFDLTPTKISRKSILWQDPRRGHDEQEACGSSKMIYTCEAILGDEVRTSLKTERSTREAGDPRSKIESTRVSLGLYLCSAFIAPIVGHYITDLIRLVIDITVRMFN